MDLCLMDVIYWALVNRSYFQNIRSLPDVLNIGSLIILKAFWDFRVIFSNSVITTKDDTGGDWSEIKFTFQGEREYIFCL